MDIRTNESDVIARIVRWAADKATVRVVLLESSRANPQAPLDVLSDYDIALLVSDVDRFVDDEDWLHRFGAPLLRVRDVVRQFDFDVHNCMVLYDDWTKIDYSIWPVGLAERVREAGRLPEELDGGYRVLLDKDGLTAGWPPPTHSVHIPRKPTAQEFQALIEECWWVATYVAKYLWRDEFLPAKVIFDYELKYLLVRRLLEWRIEIDHGWMIQPGFFGRGLQRFLDEETWPRFVATYVGPDREENWAALFRTIDLMRDIAIGVARDLGFDYSHDLDARMTAYLRQIQRLEKDANQLR